MMNRHVRPGFRASIADAEVTQLDASSTFDASRALFLLATLLGALSFWIADRPPMTDLPQHAGQIALLRDVLRGDSAFADLVRVNLLTPYLVGYGLTLPLSFAMDMSDAAQTVLTATFLAYLWMARGLRRDLGGDERLDWLFFYGFFGVAWVWGFYTFLVAAPLTLAFLRLALRHDAAPTRRGAVLLTLCGSALLLSHGLQFLFAGLCGAAVTLERSIRVARAQGVRAALVDAPARLWPYLLLAALFVAFLAARRLEMGADATGSLTFGAPFFLRPLAALDFIWSYRPRPALMGLTLIAMMAPLLMGFRPRPGPGFALLCAVVCVELALVSNAMKIGFIYQRFALYLAPFWALALRAPEDGRERSRLPGALLIASAFCALGLHALRVSAFAAEDENFGTIIDAARKGERTLSLVLDASSPGFGESFTYLHWGSWLQADKGAFVDYNMASAPALVMRFRAGKQPKVGERQSARPRRFNWSGWNADIYDDFLVRGAPEAQRDYFLSRAPCAMSPVASAGKWTLYRKGACG